MSAAVEKLENLERRIVLSLPWDSINAKVAERLKNTQKRAKVDGFRPGKAPLKMVDAIYGSSVRDEVLNDSVQQTFAETVLAEKIDVAALLGFDAIEEQSDEKVFQVAARFEVYPEIQIGDLGAQEVSKTTVEAGEAEIDKTIEVLRQQRTRFNRVTREAKNGDRVIIDFAGKIDGEAFAGGSSANYPFVLGKGQMLPEFEAGIAGMKEGDVKEVSVNFPDDYHGKDVAGKTAVFTITLNNVAEAILPEVDAEFAKALGVADGDVVKMREEIRKNLNREIKRRADAQTKESALNALLAATPIDVPKSLTAQEAERMAAEMKQNFTAQGMDAKNLDLPAGMFTEQAQRRVALGLIVSKLVGEEKLEPTEEQVKQVVADFSESYEDPQEVIDWYYSDKKNLEGPTSLAIEANVVDYILGKAKVTEKIVTFDEIMGQQA
ncbi:trigger factor [Stenoxybacter acetivorans]|uniref:trigger factor n=1 Tax=Stenoxybacter acetivorans TaxID=422441 RepID=UPI00056A2E2A|nr:trigger factor [Stenoxybacter acetivorans]